MRKYNLPKNNKGFTLTEMVISIAIFGLVIVIVYSSYALSRRSYLEGENVAEITQNGRVILERLSREIRQAREIVTELPEDRTNPPAEIKFRDGHLSLVSEQNLAQGGSVNTIILAPGASDKTDFYKDMFIKITGGTGAGQIRKIYSYNKTTKITATSPDWIVAPDSSSTYKIDTSFYYIHYYLDNTKIMRKVVSYCFSADSMTCLLPETYTSWDAIPPVGQSLLEIELETPQVIGEYLTDLELWGSRVVNIYLILEKKEKSIDFQTKIFGRNL